MVDVTANEAYKRLFRKYGVPMIRRGRAPLLSTEAAIRGPYSEK